LPLVVSYHPGYIFPLTLGVLVLAGRAVALVYEALAAQSAPAGYAWLASACLLNFPSLVSHYSDGSRVDYRTGAQFVSAHWQPGDRVATTSPMLLKHYLAPGIEPEVIPCSNALPKLRQLARGPGRLWIVVTSPRGGKPEDLARWLGTRCAQELHACGRRLDYYENVTEVFLHEGAGAPPGWAEADRLR
jgi:hypothetical protein